MSIQAINSGSTRGLQVRVFRNKKVFTKYLAFQKHGGEDSTWEIARQAEAEMELQAGQEIACYKKGCHGTKPNRNSSTGIPGVSAFVLNRPGRRPVLQFYANWADGPTGSRFRNSIQRSSEAHGVLGALRLVLDARAAATGIPMPTPRQAWEQIKRSMGTTALGGL